MTNLSFRYASNPIDARKYDTQEIRNQFLIDNLFSENEVNLTYSMYDR